MGEQLATHVLLFDIHYPRHNKRAWAAVLSYLRANKRNIASLVLGGDQLDNAEISHHNQGKPLYKPVGSYRANTEGFERDILNPLEALGIPSKVWIIGNHDQWEQDMDETHPELRGCLDRPSTYRLADRGWNVIENGKAHRIGKHLTVIHGDQLKGQMGYVALTVARRAVEIYGTSVAFGHTHTMQTMSQVNPIEVKKKRAGWNVPALCDLNPDYMRNRPSAWVNGFAVVEMRPDDSFNLYPIVITKGVFSYGGKIYGGKAGWAAGEAR